jgi:hypothetical protein
MISEFELHAPRGRLAGKLFSLFMDEGNVKPLFLLALLKVFLCCSAIAVWEKRADHDTIAF